MKMHANQQGLSLLETLLVLAIAALILILGLRLVSYWQKEMQLRQMQYNVDTLFQGLHQLYNAACFGSYNIQMVNTAMHFPVSSGVVYKQAGYPVVIGTLNLSSNVTAPVAAGTMRVETFSITQFVHGNFLQGNPNNTNNFPFAPNPLIADVSDHAFNTEHGYTIFYLQYFNPRTLPINNGSATQGVMGESVVTVAGVSIKLNSDNDQFNKAYLGLLQGSCLSSNPYDACQSGKFQTGSYVIWLRTPSAPISQNVSDTWVSNANAVQFKQLYTTYPVTYLTMTNPVTPTIYNPGGVYYQYFFCTN